MISGIVCAVPKNVEENSDEKLIQATGVLQRHVVTEKQDVFSLGFAAAQRLLDELGWSADTLNAIIFVTQTSPVRMPAIACALAFKLGARCAAFDVNLACSGYVYGLSIAATFGLRRTLLIAGDTVSRMVGDGDAGSRALFGDCVTATAIDEGRFINARLATDGSGFDDLKADPFIKMNGLEVFTFATGRVPQLIREVSMGAHVDLLLLHQASEPIVRQIGKKLKYPDERVPCNIMGYGNVSSASIPLLMVDSEATPALRGKANRVVLCGFGAGFSMGALLMDLPPIPVLDVVEVG